MKLRRCWESVLPLALVALVGCGSDDNNGGYGGGGGASAADAGADASMEGADASGLGGGGGAGGAAGAGGETGGIDGAVTTMSATIVRIEPGAVGKGPAAFGTNPLQIKPGTTVTWINTDTVPHTATSDSGVWDSGTLGFMGTFSFTFPDAGTFPYHCVIHGAPSMSGTIVVQP